MALVFLKLGGSLLGDKRRQRSFRRSVVERLGREIARALAARPGMRLLLAHGGGGLAHFPARRCRTREGLAGGGGWRGFAETRRGVLEMNRRVLDALGRGGLHPVLVSPCAGVIAEAGAVRRWDVSVIRRLLSAGQIPLIHGDAVADRRCGFTILSTEELFTFLAGKLRPSAVVLASDVEGVYLGDPCASSRAPLIPRVDRANIAEIRKVLSRHRGTSLRAAGCDVTGGMAAKVEKLYALARRRRGLEARIVSGLKPGAVERALLGGDVGTVVAF